MEAPTVVGAEALPIVIIGAGLAGLTVALHLADSQPVVALATRNRSAPAAAWAQRGTVGVLGSGAGLASKVCDTRAAGAGLVDDRTAELIARHGAEAIAWLLERGVPFS